jgi:hypothetical protein
MLDNKQIRSNYNPEVWGPKGWFFLDSIILSYPIEPTIEYQTLFKDFFLKIGDILPCMACREHYKEHIKIYPLNSTILKSRKDLLLWWIKIHNMVRKNANKELYTYNTFMKYYSDTYGSIYSSIEPDKSESLIEQSKLSNNSTKNEKSSIIIYVCIFILFGLFLEKVFLKKR